MAEGDVQMEDVNAAPSAPSLRGGLSPEASRLFRVYKTISSMLYKRGYMVPRDMRELTPASFTEKFGESPSRESLTILVVCFGQNKILVGFLCVNVTHLILLKLGPKHFKGKSR